MAERQSDTSRDDKTPAKSNIRKQDKKTSSDATSKRRCIGSACIACKKRKSKCDGALPSCAACTAVYGTACEYDLTSDHRRKGVYKKDGSKPKADTLQVLIEAILNSTEDEAIDLVKQIRACENLEDVASQIQIQAIQSNNQPGDEEEVLALDAPSDYIQRELSDQIGHMRLDDGAIHFVGGTSNLRFIEQNDLDGHWSDSSSSYTKNEDIVRSWTTVTTDVDLILHLLQLYFTWHYPFFVTLSKSLFFRDFFRGKPSTKRARLNYCTPLLVNTMLSLGCHFTSWPRARSDPTDPATSGDHFFREAKKLIVDNEEYENPHLTTVQALALMSVREAGCGREAKGWVYSGMSFRMACDMGLNIQMTMDRTTSNLGDEDVDARRITFWGCYQFDKCWSNYLGRPPQLAKSIVTVQKFDVFPEEDAGMWSLRNDNGIDKSTSQPARTRAVALQTSALCEISDDLLTTFYSPTHPEKQLSKAAEVRRLSEFHTRLEAWLKNLPKEMEARDAQLPHVLVMHMFFQLLYIHLFRPFLKYTKSNSPLPPEVSPRKLCTKAALKISKLLRLYKKTYGLKQICNIVVYIAHSACSIHLLNLPDKHAARDIGFGVRHLEEIADSWPCASRTLGTLAVQVRRWKIELPKDIAEMLDKWDKKAKNDHASPASSPAAIATDIPSPTTDHAWTAGMFGAEVDTGTTSMLSDKTAVNTPVIALSTPSKTTSMAPPSFTNNQKAPQPIKSWPQPKPTLHPPRPGIQLSQKRRSSSALYNGIDALFEENKDWSYRDQAAFYENWARRESSTAVTPAMNDGGGGSGLANLDSLDGLVDLEPNLNILDDWAFDIAAPF